MYSWTGNYKDLRQFREFTKPHKHERRKKWARRLYISVRDRIYCRTYNVEGLTHFKAYV